MSLISKIFKRPKPTVTHLFYHFQNCSNWESSTSILVDPPLQLGSSQPIKFNFCSSSEAPGRVTAWNRGGVVHIQNSWGHGPGRQSRPGWRRVHRRRPSSPAQPGRPEHCPAPGAWQGTDSTCLRGIQYNQSGHTHSAARDSLPSVQAKGKLTFVSASLLKRFHCIVWQTLSSELMCLF